MRVDKRSFVTSIGAIMMAAAAPAWANRPERRIAMKHLHTGERADLIYWREGRYRSDALEELNVLLRDWRQNEAIPIDPQLFDIMSAVAESCGSRGGFEIICGYRSLATNELLRRQGGGVARKSLHLVGAAIDFRLPDVALDRQRDAALSLKAGGVGYYSRSNFIHIDTGRVRRWGS